MNLNLRNWLKESQLIDEAGKPIVVFHGSKSSDIIEFNGGYRGIIYFTGDASYAECYSENEIVYSVYLRLTNPALYTDKKVMEILVEAFNEDEDIIIEAFECGSSQYEYFENEWVIKKLIECGYDGVSFEEEGQLTFGVFSANQIKCAKNNNGNFSLTDNNICH